MVVILTILLLSRDSGDNIEVPIYASPPPTLGLSRGPADPGIRGSTVQ